jgi:chromosome partitioning protein
MRIIAVASRKGGVGKTTISGHLAVEAERAGEGPVALIDTDPQGSLSEWWNARQAETPALAQGSLAKLPEDLAKLRRAGFALTIIDTPPAISDAIATVIRVCDLALVPARPSPHDLRSIGRTIELVEAARRPMIFVINGGTRRARMTGEAAIVLSQHGTVAPAILHHRVDFAASMINGLTVGEADPASPSAQEIAELWKYVSARLRKAETEEMRK